MCLITEESRVEEHHQANEDMEQKETGKHDGHASNHVMENGEQLQVFVVLDLLRSWRLARYVHT